MRKIVQNKVLKLRVIAFLEGISLLVLILLAVPLKYLFGYQTGTKVMGTLHGILFLLFAFNTLSVGVEQKWEFKKTTWKVLLACMIPFGSFYIDHKILSKIR